MWRSVIEQRVGGTRSLIGLMVESNMHEGNQPIPKNLADLRYGVSHHRFLHRLGNDRTNAALGLRRAWKIVRAGSISGLIRHWQNRFMKRKRGPRVPDNFGQGDFGYGQDQV